MQNAHFTMGKIGQIAHLFKIPILVYNSIIFTSVILKLTIEF